MAGLLAVSVQSREHCGLAPCGAPERGFTLLEILIALVVLMVGLLGLSQLEMLALRKNHDSYMRSQVIMRAHDMADRMHANAAGVESGNYSAITGPGTNPPTCLSTATSPTIDCTPAQIAQYDAYEWNTANANLLPSGVGTVTGPDGNGRYTIALSWSEVEDSGAATRNFSFEVKPLP